MQARDLLKEMEKMEESGMERPWARAVADTIVKAIEPLATKSDLEELRKEIRGVDENLHEEIKGFDENLRKEIKSFDQDIRKDMKAGFELLREQMKNQVLELKVWMLASQIILFGGLVATNVFL